MSRRLAAFSRDTVSSDIFEKKLDALGGEERHAFDRLMARPTAAVRSPIPAAGSFPVVLYHPGAGGSFEDNAVLFEYLASHGFVVLSSAYQSPDERRLSNQGPRVSIQDLGFLVGYAASLPFADSGRVAAIGHSMGAQILFRWIGEEDCPVDAFVSLDTTLEYTKPDAAVHKEMREELPRLKKPHIPVLLAASTQRRPNFGTFDEYLRESERYEASVRGLDHDDYLTHGSVGRTLRPGSDAAIAAAVLRGYHELCFTILRFLDGHLRNSSEARAWLQEAVRRDDADAPLALRHKPAQRTKTD